ncbi:hypothetical protein GCM10022198_23490 [Klugiella xanthotipulae]|uniref:MacB-like protein n=1 Tax=Klugiella xanthotipulae TaxID=244735 RepID=A0A543I5Q0_9MICO|nr:hypothetical protein [Klugiella xanthotipulae]TQM65925.1 hypothetical protein FB466_0745 [Klugiella xanthotipulae]
MGIIFDMRKNFPLIVAKSLVFSLFFLAFYNFLSFSQETDAAINQSFSSDSEVNLYTLTDTLVEADEFSEFRESKNELDKLGSFYNALNDGGQFTFLSIFDQPLPVKDFRGDETYDYGYGTEMSVQGKYFDEDFGAQAQNVKSIQMNKNAFEFYKIRTEGGQEIPWKEIDYSGSEVPILLGSNYANLYRVGDVIQGNFYFKTLNLRVAGFLEPGSSIFYKNEINHYLDSYILIPYPDTLRGITDEEQFFQGILSFAMINGDLVARKDLSSAQLIEDLQAISRDTGFYDYTLIDVPTYLVQMSLTKSIIEDNYTLLLSIILAMGIGVICVTFFINRGILVRRWEGGLVYWLLGRSREEIMREFLWYSTIEYALAFLIFWLAFVALPNKNEFILMNSLFFMLMFLGAIYCTKDMCWVNI